MAAPASSRVTYVPGKLCKDPTDLSTAFPHGGTALGTVRAVGWRPNVTTFPIIAEEFGGPVEVIWTGEAPVLACVAREFDSDYLTAVFLDVVAGAATGRQVIRGRVGTDDVRAGTSLDATAAAIYWSPDDANAHGVLLYRAMPLVEETLEINLTRAEEVGILCMWQATPDDSNRTHQVGPRSDLTL